MNAYTRKSGEEGRGGRRRARGRWSIYFRRRRGKIRDAGGSRGSCSLSVRPPSLDLVKSENNFDVRTGGGWIAGTTDSLKRPPLVSKGKSPKCRKNEECRQIVSEADVEKKWSGADNVMFSPKMPLAQGAKRRK